MHFLDPELARIRISFANHLLGQYRLQEEQLRKTVSEPAKSTLESRRRFFFAHLSAMLDCPLATSNAQLGRLLHLLKLWMNRTGAARRGYSRELCCLAKDCPHKAIYGSGYCGWHILRDSRQQIFQMCEKCGAPKLASPAFPCTCKKMYKWKRVKKGNRGLAVREQDLP
jgi:hypothetical protein